MGLELRVLVFRGEGSGIRGYRGFLWDLRVQGSSFRTFAFRGVGVQGIRRYIAGCLGFRVFRV